MYKGSIKVFVVVDDVVLLEGLNGANQEGGGVSIVFGHLSVTESS